MDPSTATHTFDKTVQFKINKKVQTELNRIRQKAELHMPHSAEKWVTGTGTFLRMGMATGSRSSTGHLLMKVFRNIRFTARNLFTGQTFYKYNTSNACKCSKYTIEQIRCNSNQNMVQLSRRQKVQMSHLNKSKKVYMFHRKLGTKRLRCLTWKLRCEVLK